jgi:hypothetical protein
MFSPVRHATVTAWRWSKRSFWLFLWLVFLLTIGVAINHSAVFGDCINTYKAKTNRHTNDKNNDIIGVLLQSLFREAACTGEFTQKYNGAIVAIATVMLGVFTFTLWRATHGMRQVAEMQSRDLLRSTKATEKHADIAERSLVALNRPFLMVGRLDNEPIRSFTPFGDHPGTINLKFTVDYTLRNYGRSLATIHNIWYKIEPIASLPEVPPYGADLRTALYGKERIVRSVLARNWDQKYQIIAPTTDRPQSMKIESGELFYFFYGFVRYSDIFIGKTYITGQALRYDYKAKAWATVEKTTYNYDVEEERAEWQFIQKASK